MLERTHERANRLQHVFCAVCMVSPGSAVSCIAQTATGKAYNECKTLGQLQWRTQKIFMGGFHSVAYGGHFYLVCAICDVTIGCHIHVSKLTFWRSLLNNVHILLHALPIIYVSFQARNQFGTPGGAKSFLKGSQIF